MIESIITTPQTLASNSSPVRFDIDSIQTRSATCCGWLQRTEGTPIYKIIEGGLYEIDYDIHLTSLGGAGVVALGIYRDGILDASTIVTQTLAAAAVGTEISFNKKIRVCCKGNESITIASVPSVILNPATGATVTTVAPTILNANISIERRAG